jgi:hypothetical protein
MNLMSIDSVVDEGPEEASGVERERDLPVDRTRNGGPAEDLEDIRKYESGLIHGKRWRREETDRERTEASM